MTVKDIIFNESSIPASELFLKYLSLDILIKYILI